MIKSPTKPHHRHCGKSEAIQILDCNVANGSYNDTPDRLSHAKNFADKLSESRLREMAKAYRRRWTPAARREKSVSIQDIKPWNHATGPKSGPRAKGAGLAMAAMNRALKDHSRFLRLVSRLPCMNEREKTHCYAIGQAATLGLVTSLALFWAESPLILSVTKRNNE